MFRAPGVPRRHGPTLRLMALTAGMAAASAALAAPIRADVMSNAFLAALTNAGVPYSQPATTTALGESVCPLLFQPGGSFDLITTRVADDSGMSRGCGRCVHHHRHWDVSAQGFWPRCSLTVCLPECPAVQDVRAARILYRVVEDRHGRGGERRPRSSSGGSGDSGGSRGSGGARGSQGRGPRTEREGAGQARAGPVRHSHKAGRPTAKARPGRAADTARTSTPGIWHPRSGAS